MKETKIVLVFQGLGKTYVKQHEKELGVSVIDLDFKDFSKRNPKWERHYADVVISIYNEHKYDYILCNISENVMKYLYETNISFYVVAPIREVCSSKEWQIIKERLFGRYVLRQSQTSLNSGAWLENQKKYFDERTTTEFFKPYAKTEKHNGAQVVPITPKVFDLWDVFKVHNILNCIRKNF